MASSVARFVGSTLGCCAVAGNTGTCRTSQRDGSVATGFAKPMKSLPVTLGVATGNTSRHRGETCVRRASGDATDGESSAGKSTDQPGGLAFEPSSKSKRKRRDGKNTKRATITVEGVAIEAAKGNAVPTVASVSEEAYLLFLFGYVVIIFVGGLALAGSAFKVFPDVVENWVSGTLYPAYSPTVIGFLGFSSVYGLIKTRSDPNSSVGK